MRATPLSADVAIVRCAVQGLRAVIAPPKASAFTYTAENLLPMLLLLLIVGIPPDFVVRHLLVPHQYAAWNVVIDFAAIASVLWLSGAFGSMTAMPHAIGNGRVRSQRRVRRTARRSRRLHRTRRAAHLPVIPRA